jgi:alanine racemase
MIGTSVIGDPVARAGGVLTIDLGAVAANWRLLTSRLRPGCRAAAVVKADAYGLGAAGVAPTLWNAGCRRFFVATLDEGLALRPIVPDAEIFVFNGPFPGTEADFLAAGLLPVLNSPQQVAGWAALAQPGLPLAAALHVDTGMSRLGLTMPEAAGLAADADLRRRVPLCLISSHLACADDPDLPMNRRQLLAFAAARRLFPGVEGSLAASSGIFLGQDYHADWVRPGAALYGLRPTPKSPNPMAPVVRLQGRILQVRDVDAGDTVGYGATHRATRRSRLATVAAGYADGLFRSLGNRGFAHVGDKRVPLVGRVSMDLVVFDVTGVGEDEVGPGRLIDLIGPANTADDVAAAAGTIGYEVLAALGRRFHRRYLGEADSSGGRT